jgi:hypothetical protein
VQPAPRPRDPAAAAWPAGVLAVTAATAAAVLAPAPPSLRLLAVLCFLVVCPGGAIVRLLSPGGWLVDLMLALAMSVALDVLAATALAYTGRWTPEANLAVLMAAAAAASAGLLGRYAVTAGVPAVTFRRPAGWPVRRPRPPELAAGLVVLLQAVPLAALMASVAPGRLGAVASVAAGALLAPAAMAARRAPAAAAACAAIALAGAGVIAWRSLAADPAAAPAAVLVLGVAVPLVTGGALGLTLAPLARLIEEVLAGRP